MLDIANNPLRTRQDMVRAAVQLLTPLVSCLTPEKSRMIVGEGSAHYSEDVAGMEGFSRALWALVPMLIGRCPEAEPFWKHWKEGIIHGTDPSHAGYWGQIGDYDQRMVEMAVMGTGLCFAKDRFWDELCETEQDHLYQWLNQINLYDMPKNNWRFFRVLVNIGFLKAGKPVDRARLKEDLDMMESHYTADGWYFDYLTKRDYYTLWAFHYYSLLYVRAMEDEDPERCRRFRERAALIAPRFACWFDKSGRALPYGRSLTYRFAQASFWSSLAFGGVTSPETDWGQIKGLLLNNLRYWFRMPVFDRDGVLTVGYGYPNLCAAEGYNAPGSPYWALKSFLVLALPDDHPFWQAEEKTYTPPRVFLDEQVRLLLTRDEKNRQVVAYTAGNHGWEHMHEDEKYEKFAYSTHFAFSVTKESTTLAKGAYDSMLAFKRAGKDLWHARSGCDRFELAPDRITFDWQPMEGVAVSSVIAPLGMWHVRKHVIRCTDALEAAEGAFSVRKDGPGTRPCDRIRTSLSAGSDRASASGIYGSSAIFALKGYAHGEVIHTEPNTNLLVPRAVLPTLRAEIMPGETTLLCAVWTDTGDCCPVELPQEVIDLARSL